MDDEYNQVVLAFNHWSGRSHGTISMGKNNVPVIVSYNVVTERGTLPGQVMMNVSSNSNTSCTIGLDKTSIDFGTVDPRYYPEVDIIVTATCDGPVYDDYAGYQENYGSSGNIFRVHFIATDSHYVQCPGYESEYSSNNAYECIAFTDESGSQDGTGVEIRNADTNGVAINKDNYFNTPGMLPDITTSDGGTASQSYSVRLNPDISGSTPTLGLHTAYITLELLYD
ncbi:hypothetical protein ABCU26_004981 [Klebsiella aerogenes]